MNSQEHKINYYLIAGWSAVVIILFVSYLGEVIKEERTVPYLVVFMAVTAIPAAICLLLYRKKPDMRMLRYYIVIGYFIMYLFSLVTGSTAMVFSYILPMLSLLVLYHQPRLIILTGAASMVANLISVGVKLYHQELNLSNSKDAEIQIAILFLCFAGSYLATCLYDSITKQNDNYLKLLDEKNSQIQRMTLQAIMTIANTIDAKDNYTRGHSKRVAEYSEAIAKKLNMSESDLEELRFIALLHDIGKIGVPDSILNKPGKLTNEEYELMKQHTVIGADILKDIGMIPGIDVGAKYHHERYDGNGYPEGLTGKEIPYVARIISVADAYDAMTSNRVYRRQLSKDKVMSELKDGLGKQFDPEMGRALIELIEENALPSQEIVSREEFPNMESTSQLLSRIIEKREETRGGRMMYDDLTGIFNRSAGESLVRKKMEKTTGCFVIFDVDRFNMLNREQGFVVGDAFLKIMVENIRDIGSEQLIYRAGGDEIVAFFSGIDTEESASKKMEQFMKQIRTVRGRGERFSNISVSAGIALHSDVKMTFNEVFLRADKALYHAKQQGGDRYCFHQANPVPHMIPNLSSTDLDELVRHINNRESYEGVIRTAYPEFGKIYEVIQEVSEQYNQRIQILMFTLMAENEGEVSLEERDRVMEILEHAILYVVRREDISSKYSSTQRIVLLIGLNSEQAELVSGRIIKEFYKMYDKEMIQISYNIASLGE